MPRSGPRKIQKYSAEFNVAALIYCVFRAHGGLYGSPRVVRTQRSVLAGAWLRSLAA